MIQNATMVVLATVFFMAVATVAVFIIKKRNSTEKWSYDENSLLNIEQEIAKIFGGKPSQLPDSSIDDRNYSAGADLVDAAVKDDESVRHGILKPDPSVYKWFPLHHSQRDQFRDLRLNGGVCVQAETGRGRNKICSKIHHKLECGGPKQVSGKKPVECAWRSPITMRDWLEHQKCVTYIPDRLDIDTDEGSPRYSTQNQSAAEYGFEPQICATALAKNPNSRFNVIAMFKLKLDDNGRGLGKDRTFLSKTITDGDGYGMQMTVDVHDGTLSEYTVNEMGYGYKVGDIITLDQATEKSPEWTVVSREIFPAVLDYNYDVAKRNFQISEQDTTPAELVQYMFNPRGMIGSDLFKAWDNSCTVVCTNGTDECYTTCMNKAPATALNAGNFKKRR